MRVPFLTEKVADMILRCMRTGNYITNDADVDKIREIPADASESYMNGVAATLHYGTVPGSASFLSNLEDVNVFVDSDNTNPTTPYINYFRVAKGQAGPPVTDPWHELMTIGTQSSPQATFASNVKLGPSLAVATAAAVDAEYGANIDVGCRVVGGVATNYGSISGYVYGGSPVFTIGSVLYDTHLYASVAKRINFSLSAGIFTAAIAHISATELGYGLSVGAEAGRNAAFERTFNGGHPAYDSYAIRLRNTAREETLYLNGSYPNTNNDQRIKVCIGGSAGVANRDPDTLYHAQDEIPFGVGPTRAHFFKTSCLVVSPALNEDRSALCTMHNSDLVPDYSELVTHDSLYNTSTSPNTNLVCLFRVTMRDAALRVGAFSVRADRSVFTRNGYYTGNADVAEILGSLPERLMAGTVVSITPDGTYQRSSKLADPCVVGVVSEHPGMLLGSEEFTSLSVDTPAPLAIAMAGTVPVYCTTANGPIACGDLLVSYEDGAACLAPSNPPPGSVIGKALESLGLESLGTEPITRFIKMLVMLK